MDTIVLVLLIALCFVAVMYAIHAISVVKTRQIQLKLAQSRKMSEVRRGGIKQQEENQVPDWFFEAIDELGLGDYLESEEMPPELERFLPMAKGFIESGGLNKVLGSLGGTGPVTEGEMDQAWKMTQGF